MTEQKTYWVIKTDYSSYYSSRFTFVANIDFADIFDTIERVNSYMDILKNDGITANMTPVKIIRTTKEI